MRQRYLLFSREKYDSLSVGATVVSLLRLFRLLLVGPEKETCGEKNNIFFMNHQVIIYFK